MTQLMHSFKAYTPPPQVLDGVRQGEIAAFCLFAYNVESPAQLRALTMALHAAAAAGGQPPPIVGIDQEGGQLIAVMGGATELPGNMALGATRSPDLARQAGQVLGRELLAMGCNMNFAPSLDINSNPDSPGVGVRSFGDDPALVATLGCALIEGMQAEGVIATAKHFPGHGDTGADSHYELPVVARTRAQLDACELAPFRAAVAAGVGAVMSAHVVYTSLDTQAPATFSARILTDLLRGEMGFSGLVITDAMDMGAVAKGGALHTAETAIRAGVDLVLLGHLPDQLALTRAARAKLVLDSVARIERVRESLPRAYPSLDEVGCAAHQRIAQEIADVSITVVRDDGRLPLRRSASGGVPDDARIAVITVRPLDLTPADTSSMVEVRLGQAICQRHPRTTAHEIPYRASEAALRDVLTAVADAHTVIVGTIRADHDSSQAALVNQLAARGQNPMIIALRTPYDIRAFPHIRTYLCSYGIRPASIEAVARVLFGEIPARGRLPVTIDLDGR
jgi:beta-N-acetylhexosaminidase